MDADRLVFIDTKMARLRGRAPRGRRCRASVPHGHWKTTTFTAALRRSGLAAPMVLDGPMNGTAFLAYVRQVLSPELRPGDIVVTATNFRSRWDNLPGHKVTGVEDAIKAAGAHLHYLPAYSPDPRLRGDRLLTRSKWRSQNSRPCSEKPQRVPSRTSGMPSRPHLMPSHQTNAKTIWRPADMTAIKLNQL